MLQCNGIRYDIIPYHMIQYRTMHYMLHSDTVTTRDMLSDTGFPILLSKLNYTCVRNKTSQIFGTSS